MTPVNVSSVSSVRMRSISVAALLLIQSISLQTKAAPLSLAQAPAGSGGREPAPNIIVSVDDSGSMSSSDSPTMAVLKAALNNAFSTTAVPDNAIRLGFQAMWRCRGFGPGAYKSYGTTCPENRIRPFSGTHRTGFNTWVNSLAPASNTPSHLMINLAGEYMKTTGVENPYNKIPGTADPNPLACRKSFHIFMTDGEWNSEWSYGMNPTTAGNADYTSTTLPDGTLFDPQPFVAGSFHPTNVFRDQYGPGTGGVANTVSDYVFRYWATDLQPTIPNSVRPIIKVAGGVNYGSVAVPKILPEYWNPRNDPATWQHLVQYTIGYGSGAALSATTAPKWSEATGPLATWTDHASGANGYNDLILGNIRWGNAISSSDAKRKELWHMAINGRGRYVSATNATDLSNAFAEIVNQILQDTSNPLVAISANTQSVTSGTKVYVAGYDGEKWSGYVRAYTLNADNSLNPTVVWDSSAKLDAATPANRLIFTHNGSTPTTFLWTNLSGEQKAYLQGTDNVTVAQNRLNYLRGDRSLEQSVGGNFRNRDKRQGDTVNSSVWYVGKPEAGYTSSSYRSFRAAKLNRTPMVYVGSNDGMLHGFSAEDGANAGVEKMAYVPRGAYPNLSALTLPSYVHRYFVDGHPFGGDFYDGNNWRTALIGTMAGGGKGFFVLDVTDPSGWGPTSASSIVMSDKTASFTTGSSVGLPAATWDDIGHMYAPPTLDVTNSAKVAQIAQLNNGRWAVLLGNGINSTNEKATLLIQYLDAGKELVKLEAGTSAHGNGSGNGLSHPQVIDFNGDGKADVAYAGDFKGNLWKFDLSNTDPANWNVAYSNEPLFVARDTEGNRQPITTAPVYVAHPEGGVMLAFGTGREMTELDRVNTSLQSLYAIWDNATVSVTASSTTLTGGAIIPDTPAPLYGRTSLVQQTQTETLNVSGQVFYKTSSNTVTYTGANAKRGWYLDWPTVGERTVSNGGIISKRLMYIRSRVPAVGSQTVNTEETCNPTATPPDEYLTLVDILSGKPATEPVFDDNGGGFTGTETTGLTRWKTGKDPILAQKTGFQNSVFVRPRQGAMSINAGAVTLPRVGWRQLQ